MQFWFQQQCIPQKVVYSTLKAQLSSVLSTSAKSDPSVQIQINITINIVPWAFKIMALLVFCFCVECPEVEVRDGWVTHQSVTVNMTCVIILMHILYSTCLDYIYAQAHSGIHRQKLTLKSKFLALGHKSLKLCTVYFTCIIYHVDLSKTTCLTLEQHKALENVTNFSARGKVCLLGSRSQMMCFHSAFLN